MPTVIKLIVNPLKIDEFNLQYQDALYSFLSEDSAEKKMG